MEEGQKRADVEDEVFAARFGRPEAGQPRDQRRKLVEKVRGVCGVCWCGRSTGQGSSIVSFLSLDFHAYEQVHRQLHGYSTEMEMEQYMGGRLMGGSSSINGKQVRGWCGG